MNGKHRVISESALGELPLSTMSDRVSFQCWRDDQRNGFNYGDDQEVTERLNVVSRPTPPQPVAAVAPRLNTPEIAAQVWETLKLFERDSLNIAIAMRHFGQGHPAKQIAEELRNSRRISLTTEEVESRIVNLRQKFAAIARR